MGLNSPPLSITIVSKECLYAEYGFFIVSLSVNMLKVVLLIVVVPNRAYLTSLGDWIISIFQFS